MESPSRPGLRRILLSVLILAAIFALSYEGLQPPTPKPIGAPATEFSAARALDTLHRILGNDIPHPIGSMANDDVRNRIIAEFAKLGYQPQVQTAFACSDLGQCATVNNVLARLDPPAGAAASGAAVLLAAHYDSVPAGPGDSDDGTGAASVLEIARALKLLPPPRHPIVLLIDDGEEAGLLGAQAFVNSHAWAKQVRAAVNLDARGTSGPSLMFETGSANDWAVRLFARNTPRPSTSSIFYTAYKRLPNDTDFTVFKAAGYQGLNFAFIGDVAHYHTPLDNFANVTPATLQHQGENGLAAIVAVANSDLSNLPKREAVYFDLFGRTVIHWPASRMPALALVTLFLLLFQAGWMIYKKRLTSGDVLSGFRAWLAIILVTAVLAFVLLLLLRLLGAAPVSWVAHPLALEAAFWSLAAAVTVILGVFFARRAGFWGLWSGVWIWWALLGVVMAWLCPGIGYLVLVPAFVAALAGLPATMWRSDNAIASGAAAILPVAMAGVVGFSPAVLLYDGLGNRWLPLVAVVVALLLTSVVPLCADLLSVEGLRSVAFVWIPILATAVFTFAAVVLPAYSAKAPERVNIEYWQDADSGQGRWIVEPQSGRLPEPIRLATSFHRQAAFPWDSQRAFLADAPSLSLSPPTFTILTSDQVAGRRTYRTLLRSERGAPYAAVMFPPDADVEDVRIEGTPLAPASRLIKRYFNDWTVYGCPAMPADGLEIDFSLPVGKTVEVSAADQKYEFPHEGAFLLKARPLTATSSQDGDVTIVTRSVELIP